MYDALEMPKTSGLIPKIRNKELVVEIFTTYVVVRSAQSAYKEYPDIKEKSQEDFSVVLDIKNALLSDACIDWDFFFKYTQGVSLIKQVPGIQNTEMYQYCLELIDKTITAIEKEYS